MHKLSDYFSSSDQFYYFLIDQEGYIRSANRLFSRHFNFPATDLSRLPVSSVIEPVDKAGLKTVLEKCLLQPGKPVSLRLRMVSGRGREWADWECSACHNEQGGPVLVQVICAAPSALVEIPEEAEMIQPASIERYRAFEESAEGLWMFEAEKPVSVNSDPDSIMEYWKENSFLVECNDNMARMYGFEKATELTGTRLNQFLDFSDPQRTDSLRQFIRNGFASTTVETKEFDKEGKVKYFLNRMTGVVEDQQVKRVWGTQQDITAQRLAEERLRESELFFRNLFVNSFDGIFITDEQGLIKFASPAVTPILGYETEDVLGKNCFDLLHPDDREMAVTAFNTEKSKATEVDFISLRVRMKNGNWIWCMVRGHNQFGNPPINGMVIIFFDDSIRKQTEKALQESEQRFRQQATVLNNVTDVIVTTDLNRVVTSWNHVLENLTGITAGEATGRPYRNVLDTDYSPYSHEQVFDTVISQGIWKGETSFTGHDGERKYLLHTISLLFDDGGNRIGLLGVGKDITDRKKAQARLEESELFYRNMIAQSLDGIIMTDDRGMIRYCSPSIHKISGYETADLLGRQVFEYVHPDDVKSAIDAFEREFRKESQVNYLSLRLRHSSGEWTWCTVRGHNLAENPIFGSMVIYFTNDSKRKAIEDRLRESESRFRNLIHNLNLGVILEDHKREMIIANQAALDLLGLTEDQMLGKVAPDPRWKMIHEDGREFPEQTRPGPLAIQTGKPVRDVVMGVFRPVTNDQVWLLVNAEPVLDPEGALINMICSFADITEQKKLSQKLIDQEIQKQKQVTQATIDAQEKERREIGKELHDNINQHLNTTRLYLEVAKEKAGAEVLEMISLAHKNLAGIINEIRHLSQSLVPPTLGDLGLAESIQDLCDALRRSHKFSIEFNCRHFEEEDIPGNLRLSLFRIIQEEISNIIRHSAATHIMIRLQSDAEHIFLTIMDNGKGFDPRTAREGLGLSNIRTRTALFNGKMELKTAPGEGCELTVIIPLQQDPGGD
ncbi:MAG: PAS domain S-box protein [Sphingobacteriales bacterium]|nr:PAS domain S-box protein [Sphingobacteriales bacterium]